MGERLETTVGTLQSQTHELNNLRELSDVLQNCKTPSETFAIIAKFVKATFPGTSGAILLIDNSRSMVETSLTWGETGGRSLDPFHPDECWGLRRSKPNLVEREDALTQCGHVAAGTLCYVCVPMSNHGESIGVFHFLPPPGQGAEWFKRNESLASMVCEQVGAILRQTLRESNIPCRYGGEEFVLALPGAALEVIQRRAEEIRGALEKMSVSTPRGAVVGVTASLGVAIYPDNAPKWAEVITAADRAMYRAKSGGRNRVETELANNTANKATPPVTAEAAIS
jgi:GAF domain-containing protein